MSREQKGNKETKKSALSTMKEKRAEKKNKKQSAKGIGDLRGR